MAKTVRELEAEVKDLTERNTKLNADWQHMDQKLTWAYGIRDSVLRKMNEKEGRLQKIQDILLEEKNE